MALGMGTGVKIGKFFSTEEDPREEQRKSQVFQTQGRGTSRESGVGSALTSFLATAGIGGVLTAGVMLRDHTGVAKFLKGKLGKMGETLGDQMGSSGVFSGAPGIIKDINRVAHTTSGFKKGDLLIDALEGLGKTRNPKRATVGDFLNGDSSVPGLEKDFLKRSIAKLEAEHNIDPKRLHSLALGDNILMDTGGINDLRKFTIRGLMERGLEAGSKVKIPFTNFAPTDIFLHKAWGHKSNTAVISATKDRTAKIGNYRISEDAIVIGDKLIGKNSDKAVTGKFDIFTDDSALGLSAHNVKGTQKYRMSDEVMGDLDPLSKIYTKIQHKIRQGVLSDVQADEIRAALDMNNMGKARDLMSKHAGVVEDFFIGTKFARDKSVLKNVIDWVGKVGSNDIRLKDGIKKEDLTITQRIKAALRFGDETHDYYDSTGKKISDGKTGPIRQHGKESFAPGGYTPKTARDLEDYYAGKSIPSQHVVTQGGGLFSETNRTLGHFLAERPNRLFEALTGLGIKPSQSVSGTLLKSTVGVTAAIGAVTGAIGYADYLTGGAPSKAAAATLGTAQVATQTAMNVSGISPVAAGLEYVLPGIINSAGSKVARGVGLPFLGAMLGAKVFPKGINLTKYAFTKKIGELLGKEMVSGRELGAAAGFAAGMISILMDPTKSAFQVYDEAVGNEKVAVKNARWWFLGRSPYEGDGIKYFDHSLVQKILHHDAKDISRYGSETAAWAHSGLPTPTNLFGLIPLLDPYYLENHNKELRPFPQIDSAGQNIPVLGPLIGATIGNIIKPEVEYDMSGYQTTATVGGYGPSGVTGAAQRLGFSDPTVDFDAREGNDVSSVLNKQINNLQDYSGLFGFMSKFGLSSVTGSDTGFGGGYELEGSGQINSPGRDLMEMNLGGLVGLTEWARRMYNETPNNVNYFNPIANAAPDWLPGSNSRFEGDQDYRVDFHTGDFYNKVENAEYRLPGKGYEEYNDLHGGNSYDAVDKYSVLSDVALGSQAFHTYRGQVEQMIKSGTADDQTQETWKRVEAENAQRLSGKYQFSGGSDVITPQSEMADASRRYLSYLNTNYTEAPDVPILGDIWQAVTHTRVPGLASLQGKFMHKRTPLEEYVATQVHGTEYADWQNPFQGFVRPAFDEAVGAVAGSDYIPAHVQKQREGEEYYDKLKYLKARRLEERAVTSGEEELAKIYNQKSRQTIVGLPTDQEGLNVNIFSAMPANMRPFIGAFSQSTPNEARKIMEYLPEYQKKTWENIFSVNSGQAPIAPDDAKLRADEEVSAYFSQRALPDVDSPVWNPEVDVEEYKLKTFEAEGVSYHTQGIPEAKAREYRELGRAEIIIDTSPFSEDIGRRNQLLSELGRDNGVTDFRVFSSQVSRKNNVYYNDPGRMRTYDKAGSGRF